MPFRTLAGHRRIRALLGRAVAQDTVPPSLILAGPRGVGKRRAAQALAEVLNCAASVTDEAGVDACGTCAQCRRIGRGTHPDVIVIEPGDTGAIKIEQVRDVIDRAAYRPFEGRRRVVIIDDADAMAAGPTSSGQHPSSTRWLTAPLRKKAWERSQALPSGSYHTTPPASFMVPGYREACSLIRTS